MTVGQTAFTWMLCGPHSTAIVRVTAFMPPFEAA
jgi:hypothetical protein